MSFPILICSTYSKITALLQCGLEGKEQWWTRRCSWPSGNNFIVSLHMVGGDVMTQDFFSMIETEYYYFGLVTLQMRLLLMAILLTGLTPEKHFSNSIL